MLPLILLAAGSAALAAGLVILRTIGPGVRIGRMLATAPRVKVAEALRLAESGERRYVAIEGRIDSEDEFEDAAHRPLVLRRTRLEARIGSRWTRFEESVEAVPFEVRDGLDSIAVDTSVLDEGLVVIPRESRGLVRDLADRAPTTLPPDALARARIDQVSSLDHAIVLGLPRAGEDGRAVMTAGLGRPLIMTTVEIPEAMRILAGGERARPRLAAASLALGTILLAAGLVLAALTALGMTGALDVPGVLAADPSGLSSPVATGPAPTGIGGDTRSPGQGPGLVGAPGPALLGVLLIGLAAVAATQLYIRSSGGRRGGPSPR